MRAATVSFWILLFAFAMVFPPVARACDFCNPDAASGPAFPGNPLGQGWGSRLGRAQAMFQSAAPSDPMAGGGRQAGADLASPSPAAPIAAPAANGTPDAPKGRPPALKPVPAPPPEARR